MELTLKTNSEAIVDENGIEILVSYEYEESESQIEEGHGIHEVGCMVYIELKSVEVVIKGIGIDIMPMMNQLQKESIISKLDYC